MIDSGPAALAVRGPNVIINELMINPHKAYDSRGEWIELYNAGDEAARSGRNIRCASTEQSVDVSANVRRLQPEDHELIRTIRLRSLTLEPAAFGSTLEREAAFSDDEWRQRLAPDASPHFVTTDGAGAPTGMVVGAVNSEDPRLAHLFAMWVDPHARGSGAADALVDEVKRWAAAQGCSELQLRVTEGNTRAERMYLRHGFIRTGQSWLRERDGHVELELVSRLEPTASAE